MKILVYGSLADAIGPEIELDHAGGCRVGELFRQLAADHPDSAARIASDRVRVCVGDTLVTADHLVQAGDTVELLSPVSGG